MNNQQDYYSMGNFFLNICYHILYLNITLKSIQIVSNVLFSLLQLNSNLLHYLSWRIMDANSCGLYLKCGKLIKKKLQQVTFAEKFYYKRFQLYLVKTIVKELILNDSLMKSFHIKLFWEYFSLVLSLHYKSVL